MGDEGQNDTIYRKFDMIRYPALSDIDIDTRISNVDNGLDADVGIPSTVIMLVVIVSTPGR